MACSPCSAHIETESRAYENQMSKQGQWAAARRSAAVAAGIDCGSSPCPDLTRAAAAVRRRPGLGTLCESELRSAPPARHWPWPNCHKVPRLIILQVSTLIYPTLKQHVRVRILLPRVGSESNICLRRCHSHTHLPNRSPGVETTCQRTPCQPPVSKKKCHPFRQTAPAAARLFLGMPA